MAVSRVFVKGLPPSLTEDDFRNHFAKRYKVTDVKLFPARRIGYVGFKLPQDAAAAIKYFNKTFIRMSRISVEIANDLQSIQQKLTRHPTSRSIDPEAHNPTDQPGKPALKRKREEETLTDNDTKFREYIGLLKPPSKVKHWEIDSSIPDSDVKKMKDTINLEDTAVEDPLPAKLPPKKTNEDAVILQSNPQDQELSTYTANGSDQIIHSNHEQAGDKPLSEHVDEVNQEQALRSDTEWMRSRTSRLLGLLEDDEEEAVRAPSGAESPSATSENMQDAAAANEHQEELPDVATQASPTDLNDMNQNFDALRESGRLFLRNLPYDVTEDDLREAFSEYGRLEEIHVPVDSRTGEPKGFAFLQYEGHDNAIIAFEKMDGTVFQGRLLHILPAAAKRESKLDDYTLSKLPLKKQKQIQRKNATSSTTFNWNSLYMNADAVLSSIADKLGVTKSEVLDPTSSDAAVKQAQAETHIIQDTKAYFKANGVDLDAFSNKERGDFAILVKNFPYGTKADDLKKLFAEHGDVARVLMPPSGTIAIIEFKIASQARSAFNSLAYRKFKESVLFLEKAPKDLFKTTSQADVVNRSTSPPKLSTADLLQRDADNDNGTTSTLYVRNISFNTSNERFEDLFRPLDGFISARINTKPDPKRPGQRLSMGFGFLDFRTPGQARAAQAAMDHFSLDGHKLVIKVSQKSYDAAEEQKKLDDSKKKSLRKSKIIIKNLPFEASKKDIRNLFKAYGQLRAVRVPKKFDSSRKGFAFAEFTTPREAENAMDALRDTHLLGRRLVLEYAAGEIEDPEKEIEKLQQKVGRQSNSVALQKLTASERKKVDMTSAEEAEG